MPRESAEKHLQNAFSRTRDDDWRLAELARLQHGVVGRSQLVAAGYGRGAIGARLRSGRLHRLHAGVYCVGHRKIAREGRWMAAVLACGPDAVLSHYSAAALWLIRPTSRTPIDVTVGHRSRSSATIRRHFSRVPTDERGVKAGVPVTSVPRTIFDLAATEDADAVVSMLRESEFHNLWDRLSLWHLLERYSGKRGSQTVRLALERLKEEPSGRKRSRLEKRFTPFLRRHGLPTPRFNDWILLGPKRYQVDCHWPGTGQIVELDGWAGHRTKTAFREDRARDRTLRVAGYSVTRLTWNQLDDEPEAIAADLRALLNAPAPA
jgi:very-short-patch-repair endonuclease